MSELHNPLFSSDSKIPEIYRLDPEVTLPLNSEPIKDIPVLMEEVNALLQQESVNMQKLQQSIDRWEAEVKQNRVIIDKNKEIIRKNTQEILASIKNRDYWYARSEQVFLDYSNAAASGRVEDWTWLIKKYGLKNTDGTLIHPEDPSTSELCKETAHLLAEEYKMAGHRYDKIKKDKEGENHLLIRESSHSKTTVEALQKFIRTTYEKNIEPIQDGIHLLKELNVKLKNLSASEGSVYAELRSWAEEFLNDYLKENIHISQMVIGDFRRITSIPLPTINS